MSETLGIVAAALFASVAMFQVALAAGAPLGHLAWGGVHEGRLPVNFRIINSELAAIVILFAAAVGPRRIWRHVLESCPRLPSDADRLGVGGIDGAQHGRNFASKSAFERWVFGPTTATLAVLCTVIAIGV